MVEAFVEQERFQGTAYRAANWVKVGQTTGRTRQDRQRSIQAPRNRYYSICVSLVMMGTIYSVARVRPSHYFVPQNDSKNGKTYVSYLVRESFRTTEGPRSRTICNITELPAATRQLIVDSLKGQDFLPAAQVELHQALDYGGLAVLNDAWSRFGLDELLAPIGSKRQRGLLQAVVYSRLLFPCAKLSLVAQAQGSWLAQACGLDRHESFDEDDLYIAMDRLNGQWVRLEKQLYQRAFPQSVRLVLYDLTSVFFEGAGPTHFAEYGHSRDHRGDRPQIILAVATDTEGLPIHLSILRGNRNDTQTLQGLLRALRRRFGIQQATFVFDGGMSSEINLEALTEAKLGFVTRLSAPTLQSLLAALPADRQMELGDRPSSWRSPTRTSAMSLPAANGANNATRNVARVAWTKAAQR